MSWLLEVVMQHKKPNFQYDKLYRNAKFFFFHFNSHIRWSSSFVSRFKWTKLKSWFILWQKYANKKSTMQICSNKLKSPNYICTHYCQCYFQIYVISIKKKDLFYNFGVFDHIKAQYGCYEIAKNGSLHIHTLLWFNDYLDPNRFGQTLLDNEIFRQNMIHYLNDIITWDINKYKSCPIMIDTNCIDDNLDNIHPYTTRPLDLEEKTFTKLFQNDIHKLMNICNWHLCNPTCYKTYVGVSKKCRYGFPQPLINETHFNIETKLLHIRRIDKWFSNANPWILLASRCNHNLKFMATFDKDSKSLIYYITYYITKTYIYTSLMYSLLQIVVQKTKTIKENSNSNYHSIVKHQLLLIRLFIIRWYWLA
jgi:hypothetical protein